MGSFLGNFCTKGWGRRLFCHFPLKEVVFFAATKKISAFSTKAGEKLPNIELLEFLR